MLPDLFSHAARKPGRGTASVIRSWRETETETGSSEALKPDDTDSASKMHGNMHRHKNQHIRIQIRTSPGLSVPAKPWPLRREADTLITKGAAWDCDWLSRAVASRQQ